MPASCIDRLENVAAQLGIPLGGEGGVPPCVGVYDQFYEEHVQPFLKACADSKNKDLKKVGLACEESFQFQRKFIYATTACAKPDAKDMMTFVAPVGAIMDKAPLYPRKTKVINHLKAWNEAIQAMNWLVTATGGVTIVKSQKEAAQFHLNRVLKEIRDFPADKEEKKARHKLWVNTLKTMMAELENYVKSFFKAGFIWKFGGGALLEFSPDADASSEKKSDEDRLDTLTAAFEAYAARMSGGDGDGPPRCVTDWQELMNTEMKAFLDACNSDALPDCDGKAMTDYCNAAYGGVGKCIEATLKCKKPSDEKWGAFLGPISQVMMDTGSPPRGGSFNYIKGFNESVQTLAWVTMPGASDHIQCQLDAQMMYLNKILRTARDAPDDAKAAQRAYVKTLKALGEKVKEFCKENFRTGLLWKGDAAAFPPEFEYFN